MRKILLSFLLLPLFSIAQNITFSDPNFKAKLLTSSTGNGVAFNLQGLQFSIDSNMDGEIQQSEALQVSKINLVGGNIASVSQLSFFANIQELLIRDNAIPSFALNGLSSLNRIQFENNQTTTIALSGMPALTNLVVVAHELTSVSITGCPVANYDFTSDSMTAIDFSSLTDLLILRVGGSQLTAMNVQGLVNLQTLEVKDYTPIAALNVSGCTALSQLDIADSLVGSLDATGCANLNSIIASGTSVLSNIMLSGCTALSTLDLSANGGFSSFELDDFPALIGFYINFSPITSLHVSNCPMLTTLFSQGCQLDDFSISNCGALTFLNLSNNEFTGPFTLEGCPSVVDFYVSANQITSVDVSNCPNLMNLGIGENPIVSIFAKNGSVEGMLDFSLIDSPLQYICADEQQIQALQDGLALMDMTDVVVNSYCSFAPGGNFNTIAGDARFDFDMNGCNSSDPLNPTLKIKIDDGTNEGFAFVNVNGNYTFYTGAGDFTVSAELENPSYFAPSTPVTVNFPAENGSISNQDFCIIPNGLHPDLEIIIAPTNQAQPGFDATYEILYRNKGNQTLSGDFTLNFEGDVLDFLQASSAPISQTANSLAWNFSNLQPFASGSVWVNFNVNGPMETPPVNIDDVLDFTATINPIAGDDLPADNTFTLHQTVVGSFDPNDKHCLEGATVSPDKIGNYLHYVINFENTGTFPATNIVIADEIDESKFDISTFQLTSAPTIADVRITGNKVEFILPNINLGVNERGNVTFKIKTKNTLTVGATVTNIANIFFDYNFPIETNPANTTFQQLSVSEFDRDNSIVVSPNPVSDVLHVKANSEIKSVQVYDIQGRLVMTQLPSMTETVIEMKQSNSGIYFVKVVSGEGMSVQKVMKQ